LRRLPPARILPAKGEKAMTDYATLIDDETWAFIRRTDTFYPPDTVDMTVADQRRVYDTMCGEFHRGYPPGVTASDAVMGGVPCRSYGVPGAMAATVVYFHGGGFVVGGLHSHDDVCAEIAATTGFRVVSVDYRLAPEHRHPAHFNDSLAATRAVMAAHPGPFLLCGDSAGGNLAAAVSHALRDAGGPQPLGQVLIYPGLGGDRTRGSYVEHAEAPMLTTRDIAFYGKVRFPEGYDPTGDVTCAPLHDTRFDGLPPTAIITAQCDPLASDGPAYAAAITAAGGHAACVEEPGLVHGYLRARSTVTRARTSFARICSALSAMGAGQWPALPDTQAGQAAP
jgi:acetyl esterase